MARKKVFGNCRICGKPAKLSFEHVPPQAAFNNHRVVGKHIFDLINKHLDEYTARNGHISQRGAGAYTLCSIGAILKKQPDKKESKRRKINSPFP